MCGLLPNAGVPQPEPIAAASADSKVRRARSPSRADRCLLATAPDFGVPSEMGPLDERFAARVRHSSRLLATGCLCTRISPVKRSFRAVTLGYIHR